MNSFATLILRYLSIVMIGAFISSEVSAQGIPNLNREELWNWMRLHDPATGVIPRDIRQKELSFSASLPTVESLQKSNNKSRRVQALTWTSRGPYNVGGRTRALAFDVSNENVILAGGVSGGMWRSIDGGTTWAKTTAVGALQSTTCIAQDTRAGHAGTWYYGTGELVGNSATGGATAFRGDGIFKSTDGGVIWAQLASTVSGTPQFFDSPFDYIWNVAVDPSNASQEEVYAATVTGIQRSVDGGATWVTAKGGFDTSRSLYTDVAVTSGGVVYAALSQTNLGTSSSPDRGIWRSNDGVTWENITPVGWPITYNRIVLGIAPSNENVVYFLAETPGSGFHTNYAGNDEWTSFWKYTYVSGDGSGAGGSWEDRSSYLPAFGQPVGDFATQGSYDMVVKVKPDDENTVFLGGTNLYRSTDGFATSTHTAWIGGYATTNDVSVYPNHHPDQHAMAFLPSSSLTLISGHDGGVSKTTNDLAGTVSWAVLNNGYGTAQFYSIAVDHATSGNDIVIGGLQDNGTLFTNSPSPTAPWIQIGGGDGGNSAIANNRTSYYVSSQNGLILRELIDDAGGVSRSTRVDPLGGSGYLFIAPYVLDPTNSDIMYLAAGDMLWRNNDLTGIPLDSFSTTPINWDSLAESRHTGEVITAVRASQTPVGRLYYGTDNGRVYRVDDIQAGFPAPTNITGADFPANAYVSWIAVDPTNADNALVVFSNYSVLSLFHTTDGGTSWSNVGGNLEQNPDGSGNGPSCRCADILPNTPSGTMYLVGTSTGLYSTTVLNGISTVWAQEGSSNIGNIVVDAIDTRQSDGLIVIGTHGNGAYSAAAGGTGETEIILSYDSGVTTRGVYEQPDNTDWVIANRMTAPSTNAKITKLIYYYFRDVNPSGNGSFLPVVYAASEADANQPSLTPMYTGPSYTPTPGWNYIDVSSANLSLVSTPSPEFFVGVKYDGIDEPLIAYDTIANGRAWEYDPTDSTWTSFDTMDFPATLFIRAAVTLPMGVEQIVGAVPTEFVLGQNYPNPFNPSTTIRYQVPEASWISLKIYDMLGQEVATLVNRVEEPGEYIVSWNASSASSGMYLYRLIAGSFVETRKMLLLK
jgi:hypothetical protein